MFSERARSRLQHIVEYADQAQTYASGATFDEFRADLRTMHAVERCIANITEAVIQIGEEEAGRALPDIPFRLIRGMGNRLRHEYKGVDARAVFDTVHDELPALREAAATALATDR